MRVAVRVPLGLYDCTANWFLAPFDGLGLLLVLGILCLKYVWCACHLPWTMWEQGHLWKPKGEAYWLPGCWRSVYPWSSRVPVSVWGLNGWLQSSFEGWPAQGGLRSHFMMVEGVWGRIKNKLARDFMGWSEIGLFRCFLEPQGRRYGCSVASGSARGGCGGLSSFGKAGWLVPWITHLSASVARTAKIA